MINNDISQVINQMRAIEAMAKNQVSQTAETDQAKGSSFAGMMQQAIDEVNQSQAQSKELAQALEMGDPNVDIAQVMIAGQKASVSFQALTEVRNKLLTAYQDVMNMPV